MDPEDRISPTAIYAHGPFGGSVFLVTCLKKLYTSDKAGLCVLAYFVCLVIIMFLGGLLPRLHENRTSCSVLVPEGGIIAGNSTEVFNETSVDSYSIKNTLLGKWTLSDREGRRRFRIKSPYKKPEITDEKCIVGANTSTLCVQPAFRQARENPGLDFSIFLASDPSTTIRGSFRLESYYFPYRDAKVTIQVGNHSFHFQTAIGSFYRRINFEYGYLIEDPTASINPDVSVLWLGSYSVEKKFVCSPHQSAIPESLELTALSLFQNETLANLTADEASFLLDYVLLTNDVAAVLQFFFQISHTNTGSGGFSLALFTLSLLGAFGYCAVKSHHRREDEESGAMLNAEIQDLLEMTERMQEELARLQQANEARNNEDSTVGNQEVAEREDTSLQEKEDNGPPGNQGV
mmetsp:Transcript_14057/g.17056  ORF Transcript_14057/g.17056 Transcript_14057/m.17056 type:complete len:405 (+) Transcript_14057:151-1365(+)